MSSAELIAQFLRGEGFEVVEAADGQQAVDVYSSCQPVRRRSARPEFADPLRRRGLPPDQGDRTPLSRS